MTRAAIVAAARECLGTPFHHQGRAVGVGLDCVGLLVHIAQRLGVEHADVRAYKRRPDPDVLVATLELALSRIPTTELAAGDVAVFRIGRLPQHVGVITETGLIHALADVGRVAEHSMGEPWSSRLVLGFRFPGVG